MTVPIGDYLTLDGLTVWWNRDEPDRINLATNNPAIVDDDGGKPGLWIAVSSNPRSADYNPNNFNRLGRWLADHGKPAPEPVAKASRRLRDRT
jgi:hypothetical protein